MQYREEGLCREGSVILGESKSLVGRENVASWRACQPCTISESPLPAARPLRQSSLRVGL